MTYVAYIVAVLLAALFISGSGVLILARKRTLDAIEAQDRKRKEEEFLNEQRCRMEKNRVEFMKEIEQITKSRHPASTRHQRRATAARCSQYIKNS